MNGILCVNKPQGFTSFDVIAKLRGILKIKRIGHGGTLDPMATGVLPVFIGNATKACDMMPDSSKAYRAGFRFGITTDTQDITGKVLTESDKKVSSEELKSVLPEFIGNIMQIPPMYSAVQVNGKRLYDLARQGIEVERKPREIEVKQINLLNYSEEAQEGTFEISCGKGTYIRTIIHDIGGKLGCGGAMTSLERICSGGFSIADCHTLEEIQQAKDENRLESLILPTEAVFAGLPKLRLNEVQTRMYKNGVKLDLNRINSVRQGRDRYSVYGSNGGFIGVAGADFEKAELRVVKNFI
ncbi:MAG: tRNA pseudouridine(55) synthase TruB [Ruminococcus flavefaciens]|nr:tRNA pseudouridine(55) synthase TruB [Ruminococcus flavefaciens]MCM1228940.1 tRNA pseudouridine(55) synthase TruB [Ruminococcus flavefaciens]